MNWAAGMVVLFFFSSFMRSIIQGVLPKMVKVMTIIVGRPLYPHLPIFVNRLQMSNLPLVAGSLTYFCLFLDVEMR